MPPDRQAEQSGQHFPHVLLWQDHAVSTHPFKDSRVTVGHRPRPDLLDVELGKQGGGQGTGHDVLADGHHRLLDLADPKSPQRLQVRRIRHRNPMEVIGQ